jgi:iron-sulfur cluster assembly accessory protein
MSVEIIDPQQAVTVTAAARQHFHDQIRQAEESAIFLSLKESGCTGFMYVLDLVNKQPEGSLPVALDGDNLLYLDATAIPVLQGTVIDYVRNGLNSELQFQNPNAGEYCGCGESFSLTEGSN